MSTKKRSLKATNDNWEWYTDAFGNESRIGCQCDHHPIGTQWTMCADIGEEDNCDIWFIDSNESKDL